MVVRNLERSLLFYRDLLGLSSVKRATEQGCFIENLVDIAGAVVEWEKLAAPDGAVVELLQYHVPLAQPATDQCFSSDRIGCSHVAFSVSKLSDLYEKLRDEGYHCNSEPQSSPDGKVKVMYCHDPDGIIVELVEELS
jgi:catechol 2,3-dioxygenase-like lactoylglutathione lyase family enzyme